jgi:hypothetical protein
LVDYNEGRSAGAIYIDRQETNRWRRMQGEKGEEMQGNIPDDETLKVP